MAKSLLSHTDARSRPFSLKGLFLSTALAGTMAFAGPCYAMASNGAATPQTHVYWGDVHLHTNYSWDAYGTGNTSVTPNDAYRFARGIPIKDPSFDQEIQIRRPLDFLAVTDHAIMLGTQVMLDKQDPKLLSTAWGKKLLAVHKKEPVAGVMRESGMMGAMGGPASQYKGRPIKDRKEFFNEVFSPEVREQTWGSEIDAAEKNNVPGTFTTLIGWEWTSTPGGKNLHRCVISDATGKQAREFIPFSNYESLRPEDLWAWLAKTKARTGVDFIAIPHNSNLSGGLMFDVVDSDGRPISAEYARMRMRWETEVEITQGKGTSEILPQLAPTDEFADFEIWQRLLTGVPQPPSPHDYVRTALLEGLQFKQKIGVNPYKFGFIGSTDSHTGLSAVQENHFMGQFVPDAKLSFRLAETKELAAMRRNPPGRPNGRPGPGANGRPAPGANGRRPGPRPNGANGGSQQVRPFIFPAWKLSASGRAAVWAPENTRQAIFDAFKRKEVYGTSGTRIVLRMFGGYNFKPSDAKAKDIAKVGYEKGVPMGGDLTATPKDKAPTFLVYAAKDPLSGNLDRIQIIKGWVDAAGNTQQKIYNVAWSGDRKLEANGKLPVVGNTVDIKTAHYTNTIGAPQLSTEWTDPDFKPGQLAFYYARVLEIPTPRHSLFDAIALGIPVKETGEPATIQERAWSSPIWYTPAKS